ncbi:MAG: mechanosensitive ion channel, partial [Gammaproteobacteria bacterium]|nr:mechanosensitive ion channel [Gammaproteobacteria bacterium]
YTEIMSALEVSVTTFFTSIAAYLPQALGAIILIVVGWLLARLIRSLITKIGETLDRTYTALHERAGVKQIGPKLSISTIVARTAFWLVILIFASAAANTLGLPGVNALLGRLIYYLPSLIAAIVIVFLGYILSGFIKDLVSAQAATLGAKQAASLATLVQFIVLTLALLLALRQLGVDIHLIIYLIVAAAAGLFGGIGVAFGLGAAATLRNMIAAQQMTRHYEVGQRIRIGEVEGEIVEITRMAVVIDTAEGRALVPANTFNETVSVLVHKESD